MLDTDGLVLQTGATSFYCLLLKWSLVPNWRGRRVVSFLDIGRCSSVLARLLPALHTLQGGLSITNKPVTSCLRVIYDAVCVYSFVSDAAQPVRRLGDGLQAAARCWCVDRNVQTNPGAHAESHWIGRCVNRPGREAGHWLSSTAGVKSEWSCTSAPPYDLKMHAGRALSYQRILTTK